ncbi:MAG TPA: pyridoxamine 5'-phosphate oxidase family protein [Verrucomicrobiae bacterium]|nr:pyridoxamine 5'-phosphate oxidase family protein [Verrucomicrobiae bacterium]
MNTDVEKIIREYIDKSLHMSLATVSGDRPWVCEVHFAYDDNLNLYFRSLKSRRHSQEISINPHVAGTIVKQHGLDDAPHGIYFEGTAELQEDQSRFPEYYEYFKQRQKVDEGIIEQAKQEDGHKFYKITVEKWYAFGKFGEEKAIKHTLDWNGGQK